MPKNEKKNPMLLNNQNNIAKTSIVAKLIYSINAILMEMSKSHFTGLGKTGNNSYKTMTRP